MRISFDWSALARTRWYEYGVRFLFGGAITVVTGLLSKRYGPVFGGLLLAFPAILPASATLVEKHEREKKQAAGILQTIRGRQAAALEARDAAMGSIGLAVFAFVAWKLLPTGSGAATLFKALVAWFVVSFLVWRLRKHRLFFACRSR
jgi:hypothetical protein